MEYYMDVAVSCFSIGNFNSAMAILAGLNQVCKMVSVHILSLSFTAPISL